MKTTVLPSLAIAGLVALPLSAAYSTRWNIEKSVDPITDATTYHLWSLGSAVHSHMGSFHPKLALRLSPRENPRKSKFPFDADLFMFSPALKRETPEASVPVISRFDSNPPATSNWVGSDNRCALFCADPASTVQQLLASKKLALRFSHAGFDRTVVFDLSGLPAVLDAVKNDCWPPPAKPPEKCKRCKGNGSVSEWITCPGCNGRVMNCGQRCSQCIRSIKRGKIRADVPCPACSKAPNPGGACNAAYGETRAMRNMVRMQIRSEALSESEAIGWGYYDETKSWLTAKRLPHCGD